MSRIYHRIEELDTSLLVEKKVVFTNGCFDILHIGHTTYLTKARQLGDLLVVGLNSDTSVERLKGRNRPIQRWEDRAGVLAALSSVDLVIGFDEDTPLRLIQKIRPDVITKGGDYKESDMIGGDLVKEYGGEIVILPYIAGRSSSELAKRISSF